MTPSPALVEIIEDALVDWALIGNPPFGEGWYRKRAVLLAERIANLLEKEETTNAG